ncbi:hypothetical protein [Stigmatella aurantiaca]|nr:hypothetical protein [Stigmatella aurantiaca]
MVTRSGPGTPGTSMVPVHRVHGHPNPQRQPWVYGPPIAEAASKNTLYLR